MIGLSGRYPQANTLEQYWENLQNGKNCVEEIPTERWALEGFFDPDAEAASYSKWGGFLENFSEFDAAFFGIAPREAQNIDPQERLFLQACWESIEDAGYTRESLKRRHASRVGVFAGVTRTGFELHGRGPRRWALPAVAVGNGEREQPVGGGQFLALRGSCASAVHWCRCCCCSVCW